MKLAVADTLCNINVGNESFIDTDIFYQVIKEAVPSLEQTIEAAIHLQNPNDSLIDRFRPTLSRSGLCYTFNLMPITHILQKDFAETLQEIAAVQMDKVPEELIEDYDYGYASETSNEMYPWRTQLDGEDSSVIIIIKSNSSEHQDGCTQGSKGFKVYIHDSAELPASHHSEMYIEPGTQTEVAIHPDLLFTTKSVDKLQPKARGCYYSHEKQLQFHKIYTKKNCDHECKALRELKTCRCVGYFHPRHMKTPICGPQKLLCLMNATYVELDQNDKEYFNCECLPACADLNYGIDLQTRKLDITERSIYRSLIRNITKETEYSALKFYYKARSIHLTRRTPIMELPDFLAYLGGIMSLFLGFGFLSMFEIIYYLTIRIIADYWNIRKKNLRIQNDKTWKLKNQRPTTIYFS